MVVVVFEITMKHVKKNEINKKITKMNKIKIVKFKFTHLELFDESKYVCLAS